LWSTIKIIYVIEEKRSMFKKLGVLFVLVAVVLGGVAASPRASA